MSLNDSISAAINSEIPTVTIEDSLRSAVSRMIAAKSYALMVTTEDECIGIVTAMDLMRSVSKGEDLDETRVAHFMTACELITPEGTSKTPCIQLDESETVGNAIGVMETAGVHNILVTGYEGKPVGIVSSSDLLELAIS